MFALNTSNLMMFGIKGWHDPSRKRREAEHEALSTDAFSFLPTRRKYKTLVRNLYYYHHSEAHVYCYCLLIFRKSMNLLHVKCITWASGLLPSLSDLLRWTKVCGDTLPSAGSGQYCSNGSAFTPLEHHFYRGV